MGPDTMFHCAPHDESYTPAFSGVSSVSRTARNSRGHHRCGRAGRLGFRSLVSTLGQINPRPHAFRTVNSFWTSHLSKVSDLYIISGHAARQEEHGAPFCPVECKKCFLSPPNPFPTLAGMDHKGFANIRPTM